MKYFILIFMIVLSTTNIQKSDAIISTLADSIKSITNTVNNLIIGGQFAWDNIFGPAFTVNIKDRYFSLVINSKKLNIFSF
jgi:hypothetical protein